MRRSVQPCCVRDFVFSRNLRWCLRECAARFSLGSCGFESSSRLSCAPLSKSARLSGHFLRYVAPRPSPLTQGAPRAPLPSDFAVLAATSAPGLGAPLPLHRSARRRFVCLFDDSSGSRSFSHSSSRRCRGSFATTASGLRLFGPSHLHRDWAHRCNICAGTWAHRCHICTGTGLAAATSAPGPGSLLATGVCRSEEMHGFLVKHRPTLAKVCPVPVQMWQG